MDLAFHLFFMYVRFVRFRGEAEGLIVGDG